MRITGFVFFYVYCLGAHTLCAQDSYKLRIGINNFFSAGHYSKYNEVVNNEYYTFKKSLLTAKTFPELALNLSIEKKLNAKNNIQLGFVLNDGVSTGFKFGIQKRSIEPKTGMKRVSGTYGGDEGGVACNRILFAFNHQFLSLPIVDSSHKKKINITTEICLGINIIAMPYGTPYKNVFGWGFGDTLKTNDRLDMESQTYKLDRKWGATVLGGFNLKLKKLDTEIICLSVSYEQGIWDMMGKSADIYVKNYHFKEQVFSRGSRLNITLSRAFGFPKFKEKKSTSFDKRQKNNP